MTQPVRNVVRCPKCGGVRLHVQAYDPGSRTLLESAFMFGILGILSSLLRPRKAARVYWECENCGNVFPAD